MASCFQSCCQENPMEVSKVLDTAERLNNSGISPISRAPGPRVAGGSCPGQLGTGQSHHHRWVAPSQSQAAGDQSLSLTHQQRGPGQMPQSHGPKLPLLQKFSLSLRLCPWIFVLAETPLAPPWTVSAQQGAPSSGLVAAYPGPLASHGGTALGLLEPSGH